MIQSSDFHPMRWMRNRPFSRSIMAITKSSRLETGATPSMLNSAANAVLRCYQEAILPLPIEKRPDSTLFRECFTKEISLALTAAQMLTKGRNIFALSDGLSKALEGTDIDGVRVDDIKLPYPCFYLAFGSNFEGSLPGSANRIEGAYLSAVANNLIILLATKRLDVNVLSPKRWPFSRDPYFAVPLENMKPESTFKELLDAAVSSGEIKIDSSIKFLPDVEPIEVPEEMADTVGQIGDATARNNAIEGRRNAEAFPTVKRALSLVIGTIAYLGAEPEELKTKPIWPDDTPSGMLRNFRVAKSDTDRDNAARRLYDNGFSRIRILGQSIPRPAHAGEPTGREFTEAFTRRGFFGWRAVGPNRSERKWTWIRPTIVRPDLGEPKRGHIYEIT